MQIKSVSPASSYALGTSPMVLSEIFSPSTSVAIWQRQDHKIVKAYFDTVHARLKIGIRQILTMESMKQDLFDLLPDALGKEQAIEDIHLIADMLTCLFDCDQVGLRLTTLTQAMCPKFHVDNLPVRLVTTYTGPGTEWQINDFAKGKMSKQMSSFDVGLLKGSAWGENHEAAIHRSCDIEEGQWRVLLSLDPI